MRPLVALLIPVVFCLFVAGCSEPAEGEVPVGRTLLVFEDETRSAWNGEAGRPLATVLWYPAREGAEEVVWKVGPFLAGRNAPGADVRDQSARFPLIVLSHGTGGSAAQMSWLAEELAASGFIVAGVNHHGNTAFEAELLPEGFALWWERARDVSVVIDRLESHEVFGPLIDRSRIGVAGFSLGGYTALLTVGATTDRERWKRFCEGNPADPGCTLPPEASFSMSDLEKVLESEAARNSIARSGDSYRDVRIKAAYVIAPALGTALQIASETSVSVPVHIVVGDRDDQVPVETHVRPIAKNIPGARLQVLAGVGHYTFLARCGIKGRLFLRRLCADRRGVDRGRVHEAVTSRAVEFFDHVFLEADAAVRPSFDVASLKP